MSAPASFEEFVRLPDPELDVVLGAALIAKDVDPNVDIDATMRNVADLARDIPDLGGRPPAEQASTITARFRDLGFHGNTDDYYDAKNSLLPDVLERRTGIPITLSILYCEIARRAKVLARGVAFPGHFLVRVDDPESPLGRTPTLDGRSRALVLVDPFGNGRLVDDAGAKELLRRALGEGTDLHPSLLVPASPRAILVRLLSNLKSIFATRGEHARAFVAIDRIVSLAPDSPRNLRERAAVAMKLGAVDLARSDLARVLELEPQAPDARQIQARVAELGHVPRKIDLN